MSYTIEWVENRVIVSFMGVISASELAQSGIDVYMDDKFKRCNLHIFDFVKASLDTLSLNDVHRTVRADEFPSRKNPRSCLAIVYKDRYVEMLVKHYRDLSQLLGLKWEIREFSSVSNAEEWFYHQKFSIKSAG